MAKKTISDHVADTELLLAKYKLVQEKFPDATMCYYDPNRYASKKINTEYTQLEFVPSSWNLTVSPYTELKLEHKGKIEIIRIDSLPRRNRLVTVSWRVDKATNKRAIRVSRFAYNLKKNHFNEELLNKCRVEVMQFIKNTADVSLDTKNLEPRLKKLLMFL